MTSKYLLILIVIFFALVILLPLILSFAGVPIFQFGSVGGRQRAGDGGTILLRSSDEGKTWEGVQIAQDKKMLEPREIFDIAFHPHNHSLMFLGTKSQGLWKSEDNGLSWTSVKDAVGVLKRDADVHKIAVSSSSPDTVYLAVFQEKRGRVLKSEDRGNSFREILFVTEDGFGVFDLFADPKNADHVLAVTGQGGILESVNGGKTWSIKRWFSEALTNILVNPDFPNEFFVVTSSGRLWKTFDGGENWADLNKALKRIMLKNREKERYVDPLLAFRSGGGNNIERLIPDPMLFSTLYIGSRAGLLRSTNGGFGWEKMDTLIPPEALPVSAVAAHPRRSQTLFAAALSQIHRSDDGGKEWSVSTLDTPLRVSRFFIDPEDTNIMFAALQ